MRLINFLLDELQLNVHQHKLLALVVEEPLSVQSYCACIQGVKVIHHHPCSMDTRGFFLHLLENSWGFVLRVAIGVSFSLLAFEQAHGLLHRLQPVVPLVDVDVAGLNVVMGEVSVLLRVVCLIGAAQFHLAC